MPNYRRNFVAGACYFFTVNLLEQQRSLLTDHINLLRDSVRPSAAYIHSTLMLGWYYRITCVAPGHCRLIQMIFPCVGV
jgi:REP element-mobilizing transposase RayT